MQFRARLVQVTATAPTSVDKPRKVAVKLEPLDLPEADWLYDHIGDWLTVQLATGSLPRSPIEEAIEEAARH
jgi:hypothetical protein